jgi:hypothetical protein
MCGFTGNKHFLDINLAVSVIISFPKNKICYIRSSYAFYRTAAVSKPQPMSRKTVFINLNIGTISLKG